MWSQIPGIRCCFSKIWGVILLTRTFLKWLNVVEGLVSLCLNPCCICMSVYQKHFNAVGAGISSGPAKRGIPSSEAAQIKLARTEFFLLIVGVLSNLFNTEIQLTHLCLARVSAQKNAQGSSIVWVFSFGFVKKLTNHSFFSSELFFSVYFTVIKVSYCRFHHSWDLKVFLKALKLIYL